MSLTGIIKNTLNGLFEKSEEDNRGRKVRREFVVNEITDDHIWFENPPKCSGNSGMQYCVPVKHVEYSSQLRDKIKDLPEDRETVFDVLLICDNKKGTAWRLGEIEKSRMLYN